MYIICLYIYCSRSRVSDKTPEGEGEGGRKGGRGRGRTKKLPSWIKASKVTVIKLHQVKSLSRDYLLVLLTQSLQYILSHIILGRRWAPPPQRPTKWITVGIASTWRCHVSVHSGGREILGRACCDTGSPPCSPRSQTDIRNGTTIKTNN